MILDDTLVLSDAQAITATARSTNIIDIGAAGVPGGGATNAVRRDIGIGSEIPLLITVVEGFNNLTSVAVGLEVDDDPAFASPTVLASRTYTLAELTQGAQLPFPAELPEGTRERYIGLRYTVTGTAPTLGKITAAVVAGRQTN